MHYIEVSDEKLKNGKKIRQNKFQHHGFPVHNVLQPSVALRKHAYSNILKILPPKNENFQIKIQILFLFLLKT